MTKAIGFIAALLLSLPALGQTDREQLLAPIAHYPASLRSLVLRAARYPVDIIEAANWSRANPRLQGDAAVRAAQSQPWHPSVKALLAYPQLLAWMDENLDWTRKLGETYAAPAPQAAYAPYYAPPPVYAPVARPVYPVYYVYRPSVVVTRVVTHPVHHPVHVHRSVPHPGAHHGGRRRS